LDSWITSSIASAIAYASSLMGDRGQGEDLVQDCICRLLARADHYDLSKDGRKLLFRSITNACMNHRSRGKRWVSLDQKGRFASDGKWEMEDASAPTPSALMVAKELRSEIAAGLQTLPMIQRSALELSSMGYSHEEIAEHLEVRPSNVRVLLFRARRSMAAFLNVRYLEGKKHES